MVFGRTPATAGGRRGNEASRLRVVRLFLWSSTAPEGDEMADIERELRHYLEGDVEPRAALEWSRETSAAMVDLKFCDLLGTWQHVTLPVGALDESAFDEGLGFDGSSIRGWQGIAESDMLLMPQAETAILDPFTEAPTISILCEIIDPVTRQPYTKDPRRLAGRAEDYLRSTGI